MKLKPLLPLLIILWGSLTPKLSYAQYDTVQLLSDYCTGPCSSAPFFLGTMNGRLLISAGRDTADAFCIYNDTAIMRSSSSYGYPARYSAVVINDSLYYYSDDKNTFGVRKMLKWNGVDSPHLLEVPDVDLNYSWMPLVYNNKLYFTAFNSTSYKAATYCYDPPSDNYKLICNHRATEGLLYKNKFYHVAQDSIVGKELHSTDPETGEMKMVCNINGSKSANIRQLSVFNDKLYFVATYSGTNDALYEYDGTNPPVQLARLENTLSSEIIGIYYYDNKMYMRCDMQTGVQQYNYVYYSYDLINKQLSKEDTLTKYDPKSLIAYHDKFVFSTTYVYYPFKYITLIYSYDIANKTIKEIPVENNLDVTRIYWSYIYRDALYFSMETTQTGQELFKYRDAPAIKQEVQLYPNPATDKIHLKTAVTQSQVLNIRIMDMVGRTALKQSLGAYPKGTHDIEIDISRLAAGMYICQVSGYSGTIFKGKFVKL
jgi:hypothetical protein